MTKEENTQGSGSGSMGHEERQSRERLTYEELRDGEFARLHILRGVSAESVFGLLEHCPVHVLSKDALILEKGQPNETLYLVMEGQLCVHLDKPDSEPVACLEVGQTVGELSVIDESPASAYVRASCSSRLLAIDESTFWRMVEASHEFAANMLILLADRLRTNNSLIVDGLNQRLHLEHEATVDALTGLRNRRWLDKNLPRVASRHRFSRRPFCVIMLDVDHFKTFNDNFGHSAGDRVLTAVAKTISGRLRPTDLASRYGGEEFCVMLPDTPLEGGIIAANRVRNAVANEELRLPDGARLPPVTVSLGVACFDGEEADSAVLARADAALYRAKAAGRNRVAS